MVKPSRCIGLHHAGPLRFLCGNGLDLLRLAGAKREPAHLDLYQYTTEKEI